MNHIKKTLDNGVRVILAPMNNTKAVSVVVLVGVGSNYEPKELNGISHFLEHLFFKGTKSRSKPGDINKALDRLGAEHNAFTSKEMTGFWVKAADKYFDEGLDIVSDILINPLFKEDELEKEKNVIIQEISMYEDMPQRKIFEVWDELLYPNQPAGRSIAGTKEIINSLTRRDILNYRKKHYVSENIVVIVSGNFDPISAFKKIEKIFKRILKGKPSFKKSVIETQKSPIMKIINKETDQTHIVLGIRSFGFFDERKYALGILSVILGGNTSSRLFSEIREKLGLAYYVGASSEQLTDSGYTIARAGIPFNSLKITCRKIVKIMSDFREKEISEKELKFAKDYLRGTMAIGLESSDEVALFYGEQELFYNKTMEIDEIWKKYEKVSVKDIFDVSQKIFKPSKIGLAVIGPKKETENDHFEKILNEI